MRINFLSIGRLFAAIFKIIGIFLFFVIFRTIALTDYLVGHEIIHDYPMKHHHLILYYLLSFPPSLKIFELFMLGLLLVIMIVGIIHLIAKRTDPCSSMMITTSGKQVNLLTDIWKLYRRHFLFFLTLFLIIIALIYIFVVLKVKGIYKISFAKFYTQWYFPRFVGFSLIGFGYAKIIIIVSAIILISIGTLRHMRHFVVCVKKKSLEKLDYFWLFLRSLVDRVTITISYLVRRHPFLMIASILIDILLTFTLMYFVYIYLTLNGTEKTFSSIFEIMVSLILFKFSIITAWLTPIFAVLFNQIPVLRFESAENVKKAIASLNNHIIIGGYGRLGKYLLSEIFTRFYNHFKKINNIESKKAIFSSPWLNFSTYISKQNNNYLLWSDGVVIDVSEEFIDDRLGEYSNILIGAVGVDVNIVDIMQRRVYVPAVIDDVNDPEVVDLLRYRDARLIVLMINKPDSIYSFLKYLTSIKERNLKAIVAINRTIFYSSFPLWNTPKLFYVYPDVERGRLLARETIRYINWLLFSDVEKPVKLMLFSEGRQDHFMLEELSFVFDFKKDIEITWVSTGPYKRSEATNESDNEIKDIKIPEKMQYWERQNVRSLKRNPEKTGILNKIKIFNIPHFNYRRIYEFLRVYKPHIVVVTHREAYVNLEILEHLVQTARAWIIDDLKMDDFPLIIVGAGKDEIKTMRRLLFQLSDIIRKSSKKLTKTSLYNTLISHYIEHEGKIYSKSYALVPVDDTLLNEIGAMSESLLEDKISLQINICFGRSESPGALLKFLASIGGYKVDTSETGNRENWIDFHICGASSPSDTPEAEDIFFFEGNVELKKTSDSTLKIPNNTIGQIIMDVNEKFDGIKKFEEVVVNKIRKNFERNGENIEFTIEHPQNCAYRVSCPIINYSHTRALMPKKEQSVLETRARRLVVRFTMNGSNPVPKKSHNLFNKVVDIIKNLMDSKDKPKDYNLTSDTGIAYISVCGADASKPGSMAVLLSKFLGVKLKKIENKTDGVINAYFTISQYCGTLHNRREMKRIIGVYEPGKQTLLSPDTNNLNGFLLIVHSKDLDQWEKYIKEILKFPLQKAYKRKNEVESQHSKLAIFIYFSKRCQKCPYFFENTSSPRACRAWHPSVYKIDGFETNTVYQLYL